MERMMQPSTLAHEGRVPALELKGELRLFLSFSVLTFTRQTCWRNALARVSKSRTGGVRERFQLPKPVPVVLRSECYLNGARVPLPKRRGLRAV